MSKYRKRVRWVSHAGAIPRLEVGTVTGLMLGSMSDRVMVQLRISKRYQYLVRNNSVFWLASGYSLDFGLIGGVVKTGTFNQFIRGASRLRRLRVRRWRRKRRMANTSCCWRANRKSGVNGAPPCRAKHNRLRCPPPEPLW
ncbi:Paraquat-inducible protein B [Klebsiella michiganensis]|uniref:Paraquat-inducible protein B n=1 Tax=Klebsiella michiganensis TaxID=1134687 RepID=A0A7H4MWI2_9ENTR|nr:Paraquat-inducible protein B [Klebsiella michiganensis]